ncbi:MAG: hypothetical protein IIX43_04920, partial [Bacteroidales bacterium]|nr:hypothetical protein [Bacteroidales bacterium]
FALDAIEKYKQCQCKSKYTTHEECMAARHGMDLAKMVLHNVPTINMDNFWEELGAYETENGKMYLDLEGIRLVIAEGKIEGWYVP